MQPQPREAFEVAIEIGDTGAGLRRMIAILGGTLEGPQLRGHVPRRRGLCR